MYYVDHIGAAMDRKVFFTTIKVLGRADINQNDSTAATMKRLMEIINIFTTFVIFNLVCCINSLLSGKNPEVLLKV